MQGRVDRGHRAPVLCRRRALSREASPLAPGDEAAVVRLAYRIGDPAAKGRECPADDAWVVEHMRRLT